MILNLEPCRSPQGGAGAQDVSTCFHPSQNHVLAKCMLFQLENKPPANQLSQGSSGCLFEYENKPPTGQRLGCKPASQRDNEITSQQADKPTHRYSNTLTSQHIKKPTCQGTNKSICQHNKQASKPKGCRSTLVSTSVRGVTW